MARLMTIKEFMAQKERPWPKSESALRSLIFDANNGKNKFQEAFRMIKGRSYINVEEFWRCIDSRKIQKKVII